jgi:hypothetical protein
MMRMVLEIVDEGTYRVVAGILKVLLYIHAHCTDVLILRFVGVTSGLRFWEMLCK